LESEWKLRSIQEIIYPLPLWEQGTEPFWNRFIDIFELAILELSDLAERYLQVIVVEYPNVREFSNSGLEIGQGARVAVG
jgi:hypothetical protein